MPSKIPVELLDMHRADAHGFQGTEVINDLNVKVEVLPETVGKPVFHRGCSVGQFKSFHMAWDWSAEKYRSWFKGEPGEEDEHMLNDQLNYELLACIPATMEKAIYKADSVHPLLHDHYYGTQEASRRFLRDVIIETSHLDVHRVDEQ